MTPSSPLRAGRGHRESALALLVVAKVVPGGAAADAWAAYNVYRSLGGAGGLYICPVTGVKI